MLALNPHYTHRSPNVIEYASCAGKFATTNQISGRCEKWGTRHEPRATSLRDNSLAPARLFIETDTQCGFRHHLMGEEGIGGMDSTQTGVANQSLVTCGAKDPRASSHVQPEIDDAPGALDRTVFGRKDF
jgi:hypothetical protein